MLTTSLGRVREARSATDFAAQLTKPVRASALYEALLETLGCPRRRAGRRGRRGTVGERAEGLPLRILLAEDNAVNQKLALLLLEKLGYRADVATNGLEALEALERQPYDVVLMDVQMPELDGLEATRRIVAALARRPATADHRHDRECDGGGPRGVLRGRHGGLRGEADPAGGAGRGACPLASAHRPAGDEHVSPAASAVDSAALDRLRESVGEEFLGELVGTFLDDAPAQLTTLRGAFERGDAEEARRAAHTLKSNGATFGAEGFSELCRQLEEKAKASDLAGTAELIGRAEAEYARVEASAYGAPPGGVILTTEQARILVVDDDPLNRKLLVRLLEQEGHRARTAENGREALELLRGPADVVLLDIVMPELDGISVLEQLKSDPGLTHIPVIMISAVDELESVVRCIEIGAEDYLPKPFDAVLLRARINAGLTKKRLYDLEREQVRGAFSRFVPEHVVDEVLARTDADLRLAGSRNVGTIMFTDIRGFTTFTETAPPELVLEILNDYFDELIEAIFAHGGTLVGYRGDGLLVVFGAPLAFDDHADRALAAAREMLDVRLPRFNGRLAANSIGAFRMGIGLNSGPFMSGNVGSERRHGVHSARRHRQYRLAH